ncbi:TPA: hypothetical protein MCY84_001792 [Klebsiella pneumoniae]|nr:hypothetical protein [Klebsiella pneumoniae]
MKITEMHDGPVRERILNAAQAVMARTSSVSHLLEEADKFLAHEFEDPFTQRKPSAHMIEALKKGNGCIAVSFYVEADGVISGHKVEHEFPRKKGTPNYLKVSEVESQAFQEALASMKGKTYTKRTIVTRFLEYIPEMVY